MPSQKQTQEEHGHALGPFDKDNFRYDLKKDQYICPEGKRLKYRGRSKATDERFYRADPLDCQVCANFGLCTKSPRGRQITRMQQEGLKQQLERIYQSPQGQEVYKLRKEKVELPFGHMKRNLKAGQFMLRSKAGVDAELSILSTCFNIARMITLIGIPELILSLNGT